MALNLSYLQKPLEGGAYISDHRLCLDKDGAIVKETDPAAVSLLVGVGGIIPGPQARALGLVPDASGDESDGDDDEGDADSDDSGSGLSTPPRTSSVRAQSKPPKRKRG